MILAPPLLPFPLLFIARRILYNSPPSGVPNLGFSSRRERSLDRSFFRETYRFPRRFKSFSNALLVMILHFGKDFSKCFQFLFALLIEFYLIERFRHILAEFQKEFSFAQFFFDLFPIRKRHLYETPLSFRIRNMFQTIRHNSKNERNRNCIPVLFCIL